LKDPIVEHDGASVIKEAHKEKAPSLDGFVGLFFDVWWDIIKETS
jgi:hypothetical protein